MKKNKLQKMAELFPSQKYWTIPILKRTLKVPYNSVQPMIKALRKKGMVIVTGISGYTVYPKDEDYIRESKVRGVNATGNIKNGFQTGGKVFQKIKEINSAEAQKILAVCKMELLNNANAMTIDSDGTLLLR